ncbi:MAG: XRE family transcriptional regulator [Desulfuromonadaceae bacterium]|nr:XRE family transcriptional regulator [Desulfuromonadaceae bacterium]
MKLRKIIGIKLKTIRLANNLTIQELAQSSAVSSNMISRIERGLTTPSVEILMKLAMVFQKSIDYFVEEIKTTNEVVFTSCGHRTTTIYENNDNMLTESFTGGLRDPQFTSFFCTIPPGGKSGVENMYHPGDELIYLLAGCLHVEIAHNTYILSSGDSLSFKSHLPHKWQNVGDVEAKVIWTLSPFTVI